MTHTAPKTAAPATTARTAAPATSFDRNEGMISGVVTRVQALGASGKVAVVTLAGQTDRPGGKGLIFFEQVKLFGRAAQEAFKLEEGEAILVTHARISQERWVDEASSEKRSKLIVIGRRFIRLNASQAMRVGEGVALLNAANEFHLSGRLTEDPKTTETRFGPVTEFTVACNYTYDGKDEVDYIRVEMWGDNAVARKGRKGSSVVANVVLKTDKSVIEGKDRYFTKGEARSVFLSL